MLSMYDAIIAKLLHNTTRSFINVSMAPVVFFVHAYLDI